MAGLDKWLTDFLICTGNVPSKPSKPVTEVLEAPTIGISRENPVPQDGKPDDEIYPVFSKVVGETVYFVNHNDRQTVKELDGATYFLDELQTIVDLNPKPDELRMIHLAKKKFGGTVSQDSGSLN
jgi:hypothetical protein